MAKLPPPLPPGPPPGAPDAAATAANAPVDVPSSPQKAVRPALVSVRPAFSSFAVFFLALWALRVGSVREYDTFVV